MIVTCSVNDAYVWPLLVHLTSLAKVHPESHVHLGVLGNRISASNTDFVAAFCKRLGLKFTAVYLDPSSIPDSTTQHVSKEAFAKFLLADEIRDPHLWIDADTVLLRPIAVDEIKLDGNLIGMVKTAEGIMTRGNNDLQTAGEMEFNSGFIAWSGPTRLDWDSYIRSVDHELVFEDQEVLNMLYAGKIAPLSGDLNWSGSNLSFEEVAVLHFMGNHKPWHASERGRLMCLENQCAFGRWYEFEIEAIELADKFGEKPRADRARKLSSTPRSWRLRLAAALTNRGINPFGTLNTLHPFLCSAKGSL